MSLRLIDIGHHEQDEIVRDVVIAVIDRRPPSSQTHLLLHLAQESELSMVLSPEEEREPDQPTPDQPAPEPTPVPTPAPTEEPDWPIVDKPRRKRRWWRLYLTVEDLEPGVVVCDSATFMRRVMTTYQGGPITIIDLSTADLSEWGAGSPPDGARE